MSWHIDTTTAERYVDRRLDAAGSASVEAHVERCGPCRSTVSAAASSIDGDVLDSVWVQLTMALDEPHVGRIERAVRAVGVREPTARVLAATRRSRHGYVVAAALCIAMAVAASRSRYDDAFAAFLLLAPLGPLVATAWSFRGTHEVLGELTDTVPTSALWILLVRTVAAVVPALALTALALPWLLDRGWLAVGWLLPSLALVGIALALSSWMAVDVAAFAVGVSWSVVILALRVRLPIAELVDAISGPVQLVSSAVLVAAAVIVVMRRSAYEYREV